MSKEKSKYNNTKTIEDSIGTYWSNVGGYISDAMETMDNEIANRIPDVKETINTVGTRNAVVCPHCFVSDGSLGNKYRVEGEVVCPSCRKNYLIRHFVVVEYSTFKIEDNNEN